MNLTIKTEKGTLITGVESATEASQLVCMIETSQEPTTALVERPKAYKTHKKRRRQSPVKWLQEEEKHLIINFAKGRNFLEKDKTLRKRHTKSAITGRFYCYNSAQRGKYGISDANSKLFERLNCK